MSGQVLNTEQIGSSGQPIIMLHGWGQSLDCLRSLADLLWRSSPVSIQIHLIDLPGFGKSPVPDSDWDTVMYADCIHHYMQEKGLPPADILGHSFGGRVALRLTRRHPDKIRSMILINSGGLRRTLAGQKKLRAQVIRGLGKLLKRLDRSFSSNFYESWFVPKFGSTDYRNAGPLRNILVKTVNEDISEDAAMISIPTFILWGELDQETPLEMGQRLHTLIPDSQLVVLPGKDHYAFLGNGAHLCARYIINFLDSLPPTNSLPGGVLDHA